MPKPRHSERTLFVILNLFQDNTPRLHPLRHPERTPFVILNLFQDNTLRLHPFVILNLFQDNTLRLHPFVILNLFQDNTLRLLVILKQVQDDDIYSTMLIDPQQMKAVQRLLKK